VVIALAGNKADMDGKRKVNVEEAQQYAQDNEIIFLETSAKTALNVRNLFLEIGMACSCLSSLLLKSNRRSPSYSPFHSSIIYSLLVQRGSSPRPPRPRSGRPSPSPRPRQAARVARTGPSAASASGGGGGAQWRYDATAPRPLTLAASIIRRAPMHYTLVRSSQCLRFIISPCWHIVFLNSHILFHIPLLPIIAVLAKLRNRFAKY
jgi:hypothetical protein